MRRNVSIPAIVLSHVIVLVVISVSFLFAGIPIANTFPVYIVNDYSHIALVTPYLHSNNKNLEFDQVSYNWNKSNNYGTVDSKSIYVYNFDFTRNCKIT